MEATIKNRMFMMNSITLRKVLQPIVSVRMGSKNAPHDQRTTPLRLLFEKPGRVQREVSFKGGGFGVGRGQGPRGNEYLIGWNVRDDRYMNRREVKETQEQRESVCACERMTEGESE